MHRLALPAALFLALIVAANYVTAAYGVVGIGFGLAATAGTYLAGATFVVRDMVQDALRAALPRRLVRVAHYHEVTAPGGSKRLIPLGIRTEVRPPSRWRVVLPVVALIAVGAGLSAVVSPALALASGCAFLLAELVDLFVYTPLRDRGYVRAAIASNVAGAVVDTFVFLYLAGFPIVAGVVAGQLVGKAAITAVVVGLVVAVRVARRARVTA